MNVFPAMIVLLTASSLGAQALGQQAPASADAERARIANLRQKSNASFDAEEIACQSSFVVTSCVHDVDMRRIEMLSKLRQQDAVLNDSERSQRGDEQRARMKEKADERALTEASRMDPSNRAIYLQKMEDAKERQQRREKNLKNIDPKVVPLPVSP
jgi:hypothetical protein